MNPIAKLAVLVVLLALGWTSEAFAQRKVALVVGVSRYEHVPPLRNSLNDEADMAAALRDIGFEVMELRDPDQRAMTDGVAAFSRRLPGADIAAFYYSGHAIQIGERNFLIPRDANLELQSDVALRTLDLGAILAAMESNARVRVVLLDACRDNPFQGLIATRSVATRGLLPISAGVGTFVAFATAPGTVAADGEGRNSPFASALLKYIRTPGLELHQLLRTVRADVLAATGGRQVPWDHSSLVGEVILANAATGDRGIEPARPAPAPAVAEVPRTVSASAIEPPPAPDTRSAGKPMAEAFSDYADQPGAKAFAVSANGVYGVASGKENIEAAMAVALYQCNRLARTVCRLRAVQNRSLQPDYERFDTDSAAALKRLATARPGGDPAGESLDSGIRATSELKSPPYHGGTPIDAPGARRITTAELVKLMNSQDKPILIDVRSADDKFGTLPGAFWIRGGGSVGASAARTETISDMFGRLLDTLVAGKERPLVLFCTGPDCWLSHNAAMRAVERGYKQVLWYRGGTEAWNAAKLPMVAAVRHGQVN